MAKRTKQVSPILADELKEQAGYKCQQCGAEQGKLGAINKDGAWMEEDSIHSLNSDVGFWLFQGDFPNISRVVLVMSRIDHDSNNVSADNLRVLCAVCHLAHTRTDPNNKRNRAKAKFERSKKLQATLDIE